MRGRFRPSGSPTKNGKMYLAETQSTRSRKEPQRIICRVFSACSAPLREKFLTLSPFASRRR
jgi:hypothetical protein